MGKDNYLRLFEEFIKTIGLTEKEKETVVRELYSEESISRMPNANYLLDEKSKERFCDFVGYLYSKIGEYGVDYIRDALEYAFSYKDDNNNLLDQFIRFVAVTNFDEIKVDIENKDGNISVQATLGGLELSHNRNVTYVLEENRLMCEWFHNRRGLKRTKIGSLMMTEFFKYALNTYPDVVVCSDNVRRDNVDAQAFYRKIGFSIIDLDKESNSLFVEIGPDKMRECINNNEGVYPVILFEGRRYDYTTYKNSKRETPIIENGGETK